MNLERIQCLKKVDIGYIPFLYITSTLYWTTFISLRRPKFRYYLQCNVLMVILTIQWKCTKDWTWKNEENILVVELKFPLLDCSTYFWFVWGYFWLEGLFFHTSPANLNLIQTAITLSLHNYNNEWKLVCSAVWQNSVFGKTVINTFTCCTLSVINYTWFHREKTPYVRHFE